MNEILTAVQDNPRRITVFNAVTGATINILQLDGDLLSSPIVVGDACTFTVQLPNTKESRTHNMRTGALINKFVIN